MAERDESQSTGPARPRGMWLVLLLIGLMCAIEAAMRVAGWMLGSPLGVRSLVLENAAFWPGLLGDWRPNYAAQPVTMFVTYGFLHGGLVHLGVNMVALWSLGSRVLERSGPGRFAAIYVASLLGGAAVFGLLAPDLRPMVGASGALFGLAGAVLAWDYGDRVSDAMSPWPVIRAVALLLGLNILLWWAMGGLLAWQTHLGGFMAGWLVAVALEPVRGAR